MNQGNANPWRDSATVMMLTLVALQLVMVASLMSGRDTLISRDVLTTHFPLKAAQAESLAEGVYPRYDPRRGQPSAGNPNALLFYPTTFLFSVGETFWALNAHFWLHFLAAPWAFFFLARRLGLRREEAVVSSAAWVLGGFYLSHFAFYNLIPATTWIPLLVALALGVGWKRPFEAPAFALVWCLILLGGDPTLALISLSLALSAWWIWGRHGQALSLIGALALGGLLAAPVYIEMLRILPHSRRAQLAYSVGERLKTSFHPGQIMDWALPFFFGRPDKVGEAGFWGHEFFQGDTPFFGSTAPGWIFLLLALVGFWGARSRGLKISAILGLFIALGAFNPLIVTLAEWPLTSMIRFPAKAWILVAIPLAFWAGQGWGLLQRKEQWRRFLLLTAATLFGLCTLAGIGLDPTHTSLASRFLPPEASETLIETQFTQWFSSLQWTTATLALFLVLLFWGYRRPRASGLLLIGLAAFSQAWTLRPLLPRDSVTVLREAPPMGAHLPRTTGLASAPAKRLLGPRQDRFHPPSDDLFWVVRRERLALHPFGATLDGFRSLLYPSAEGLDSHRTTLAAAALRGLPDPQRVKLLESWGVEALVSTRPLQIPGLEFLEGLRFWDSESYLYRLPEAAPDFYLAREWWGKSDPNEVLSLMLSPKFRPGVSVVVERGKPTRGSSQGRIIERGEKSETYLVEVTEATYGVWPRPWQPDHRILVDGVPTKGEVANLHQCAVRIPAGRHRVEWAF